MAANDGVKTVFDKAVSDLSSREVGMLGEQLSVNWLEGQGLSVLDRNLRTWGGEVDLVLDDEGQRVLCEVKSRLALDGKGDLEPEAAVNSRKRRRYRKIAKFYLAEHPDVPSVRFDVCGVLIHGDHLYSMRYHPAAFFEDE